jgi:hypothetical protein
MTQTEAPKPTVLPPSDAVFYVKGRVPDPGTRANLSSSTTDGDSPATANQKPIIRTETFALSGYDSSVPAAGLGQPIDVKSTQSTPKPRTVSELLDLWSGDVEPQTDEERKLVEEHWKTVRKAL